MYKNCVICGKEFFTKPSKSDRKCCSTTCAGIYRKNTYGCVMTEEMKQQNAKRMKALWERPEFRENNHKRMTENNPSHQPGVIDKIRNTRIENNSYTNQFKYGNGKISPYEQVAWSYLKDFDFIYNYAIGLKDIRESMPEKEYPKNYKPDFTNPEYKICIEIDGPNHQFTKEKDKKKDECLSMLGYKIFRFTHEDIDTGSFYKGVDEIWQKYCQ